MALKHRLDRFLSLSTGIPKREVRLLLAQQRVKVDGCFATSIHDIVDEFSHISLDGKMLQTKQKIYLMMHKPTGVVSATKDKQHKTVIDLLRDNATRATSPITIDTINTLHIVGRLDLNSSGLLLLTNDSEWSRRLMSPEKKVEKVYEVGLQHPISDECIAAFAQGMYFPFEDIITQPAKLERCSNTHARVTLTEGKYHQIKRMFGRFRNPVVSLHRTAIGKIVLDPKLNPGEAHLYHLTKTSL